ncbi:MAG: GNAT family N-acetyltransferase [Clostridia bacterium]|nr:GNAT family N-acetyltransferase [Clostridia bacterium]
MEFRVLSAEDRAAVTSLFADVFTNEPWNDDWSDTEQLDAYIADLTGQSYSLTLGYYDGDRLAALSMGYIKHWYSGTEYCIDEFCVGRPYQGRGVGSAFLREIESYLRERNICQIFLQTENDVPAYAFYKRRGFQELEGHVSFGKRIDGI